MATPVGVTNTLNALERARENCARLVLMVQEIQLSATPLQSAIDLVVSSAANNSLTPKPSYSADGVSYQWESYQESLLRQVEKLTELIAKISGPYEVRSRGR